MIPSNRKLQAEAYAWKRARLNQLRTEIRLYEELLRLTREQYADIKSLEGRDLALRYGWESPADIEATMKPEREFQALLEELLVLNNYWELSRGA